MKNVGCKKCVWSEKNCNKGDFPDGAVGKNLPSNAGSTGLIPGPGRLHMLQSN